MRRILLFWLMIGWHTAMLKAQCINAFPNTQTFDSGNGGWVAGGTGSDWTWGSPSKPIINGAFSGQNCWIAGGLTNSFYNLGERSFVESPCYDFTGLTAPYVEFMVFWETERTYDGANFQYSTNNGQTWTNVGSASGAANCFKQNWFNSNSITNLSNLVVIKEGWSGNTLATSGNCQGGSGSGGWVLASHCMQNLAGLSNVKFRFTFGAGTSCNDYDGFAFDDFTIRNVPRVAPEITYVCQGNNLNLNASSASCPIGYDWEIYPPNRPAIASSGNSAACVLDTAGDFGIRLIARGACGQFDTTFGTVYAQPFGTGMQPVSCFGLSNGQAIAYAPPGRTWVFVWQTNPSYAGDTLYQVPSGTYTVIAVPDTGCGSSREVQVFSPPVLTARFQATADTCSRGVGALVASASGGTGVPHFLWATGDTLPFLTALAGGEYAVTITDDNGCELKTGAAVPLISGIVPLLDSLVEPGCLENSGLLEVSAEGGLPPYRFTWSNGSLDSVAQGLGPGIYAVQITDVNGCTETGRYALERTECEAQNWFPTAFSPNGDGVNEVFRAVFYEQPERLDWKVFNRWGNLVYEGTAASGWDGTYLHSACDMGVYVWYAEVLWKSGKRELQRGNVTLLR